MKITAKTTKEELVQFIGDNVAKVKELDKGLFDRIAYTAKVYKKDAEKVMKTDLATLAKEVIALFKTNNLELRPLAETLKKNTPKEETKETPVEKSEKKKLGKAKAKDEPKEEPKETPKKDTKAKAKDKDQKKESGVAPITETESNAKANPLAENFKDTFTLKDADGEEITYEIAHDIKDMPTLYEAMENGDVIVFAFYWTSRHLKQFDYFPHLMKTPPKEFPLDLDLATCLYASDAGTCAYVMSMYSEGMYAILPNNLEEFDGVRFSNGAEFQIYRQK